MSQTKVEAPFVENNVPFRNLVINGGMKIAQRATSATAVVNGAYQTVDRMKLYNSSDGAYTSAQTALSLTDQATTGGQTHALDIQCTTADTSVGAAQYAFIYHLVEAQNCQHLKFGTSSAVDLTIQFYVKSNLTGTTCGFVAKEDTTYCQAPFEFTINSANTWERKIVTIPANDVIKASSSIINNDNGPGIGIGFNLLLGGNYDNGTNLTWETGGASYATTNLLNFLSSTDNDFFITGLQVEVGSGASDFEHLPIDVELQRCQRYLYKIQTGTQDYGSFGSGHCANATSCISNIHFQPQMCKTPTLATTGTAANYVIYNGVSGVDACTSVPSFNGGSTTNTAARLEFISSGNLSASGTGVNAGAGSAGELLSADGVAAYLMFHADI
tara:strand:- start:41 stop:1198 length:1158 start_codon:yes stop_codon:yes gene_type:complete